MTEKEYFNRLEFRICREFGGMRETHLRATWCDGFIPEVITFLGNHTRITGRVWLVFGKKEECWDFSLLIGGNAANRNEIAWESALPDEDVTGWLSLDFDKRFMRIKPASGYPDPEPCCD